MANIICQVCNKPNPDTLEICQFCGTPLKNRGTEPLPVIRPGEAPIKQQTSDLENTLPTWLRDMRKGNESENSSPTPAAPTTPKAPAMPEQAKPEPPKKMGTPPPLDFLAGLSQISDDDDEDEPDWLASLKSPTPSAPAAPAVTKPDPSEDWLSGLTGGSSPEPQHAAESNSDVDWLSGLTDSSSPEPQQTAESASDVDWLSGLTDNLSPEPKHTVESESDSSVDWLSGFTDTPSPAPKQAVEPAAEQSIDWLADLQGSSQPQATSEQPAMDWGFDDAGSSSTTPAAEDSEGTPDWLTALKAQDTNVNPPARSQSTDFSSGDADLPSGDFPDWLSNLSGGESTSVAAVSTPAPEPSSFTDDVSSNDDVPDWLAGMAQNSSVPAQPVPQPSHDVSSSSTGDFPDWLSSLGGEETPQPTEQMPKDEAQVSSSSGDMPDWLSGLTSDAPTSAPVETPASTSSVSSSIFDNLLADDGSMPGWFETPAEAKPAPKPEPPPLQSKKAFSTGSLEELTPLDKNEKVPDWLAGLSATTPKKAPEPAVVPDENAFDWLGGGAASASTDSIAAESKPAGQTESRAEKPEAAAPVPETSPSAFIPDSSQNLDSIFSMEMPDWLSGFTPSSEPEPAKAVTNEQPTSPLGDKLSPADLPSWVQAMRPLDSVVAGAENDGDDQQVEKEGPLAGLRSVLPAQATVLGQRKPKAYSIKLLVDSTQLAQATLLENLIASEAESRPVITPQRLVNIRPLRWVIAVVLLLAVLVPAVMGIHLFPLPAAAQSSDEIGKFYDLVDGLPDQSPVLVVFDYQPGYAGEMEQLAGPVIAHLMSNHARLAFVSTSPTGVLMNERLMAIVDPDTDPDPTIDRRLYTNGVEYIDLGYLPGDAAGIQVFAEKPDVLGVDYQHGNLWTADSGFDQIKDIGKLSGFDAAIVLTDNPDTGRMWIEQAGLALQGSPMLTVVSAQAAPMIRPYYLSGQVQGMVSGLSGGAVYEATSNQPGGNASVYWDAYGAGMIAAELLLVIGGVWALVQRLRMRRAEQNQEEEEA